MKKLIVSLTAALLAACLLTGALAASDLKTVSFFEHDTPDTAGWVYMNGDSNLRALPDLNAKILEVLKTGTEWEYLNVTEYDSRGVAWYLVYGSNATGWVSSKYAVLQWPTFY